MSSPNNTVVAIFEELTSAQAAKRALISEGISENDIDVRSADNAVGMTATAATTTVDVHRESGISGWFHSLFGDDPHEDESHFNEAVRRGHAVVTVTAASEDETERASKILNANGAVDIDKRVESWRGSGYAAEANTSAPIPVIEEELQVGKRVVNKGGVRVYSRVVDQPVEEQINLREEHVHVDRRPVDRAVTAEDLNRLRDQTIEVNETAEEAVVTKRARVTEEISVGKDSTERTETVRDTVRRTEVQVDELVDGDKAVRR